MIREAENCEDLPALERRAECPMMRHMGLCLGVERDCQQGFLDNFDYNVYAALD